MTDDRLAHAGYIRAVAGALEEAGVPVADWRADPGPPRDGWIPFDLARQTRLHGRVVWDHDAAGAGWSEERGWYLLTVDDPAGRDVRTARALEIPVIAAPRAVARTVAAVAGLPVSHAAAPLPRLDSGGAGTAAPDLPGHHAAAGLPGHRAGTDFPGHRAGTADPAFEEALRRYSPGRTKSVDGRRTAAEGRG